MGRSRNGRPSSGAERFLDRRGKAFAKRRILERVTELRLQFMIGNSLIRDAPLARGFDTPSGRRGQRSFHRGGKPRKKINLADGFIIDGVVDLTAGAVFQGGNDTADD